MAKTGTRRATHSAAKPRPRPGRPKDEAKGSAVLMAAAKSFLKNGLEGTSMDAVAREAGVSKLTVYSHFQNKEALFKEVIRCKCSEFAPPESFAGLAAEGPRKALTRVATAFLQLMLAPEVLAMHRVVIGEAAKNPKIAQLMYEAGPIPAMAAFADLLRTFSSRGLMEIGEPERAADYFFGALKGDLHFRALLNLAKTPSEAEMKRHVEGFVDMFLRAYAPR